MVALDISRLQTETQNSRTVDIDDVSTLEMCKIINDEDATIAHAVELCLPDIALAIDAIAPRVRNGGRLIYVGAGTSGRLGILDASEIMPTFSAPEGQFVGIIAGGDKAIRKAQEGAEDSVEAAVADLETLNLHSNLDTLIGIAASGRTPYVLSCLKYAKSLGCLTIGLACSFPSEMSQYGQVDHMISVVTGPEVVTGSTRLKAGTGTKLVLNMLSTGVMIKIGKTFGNMMVDVQSSNLKLKQRARNIVRGIAKSSIISLNDDQLDAVIKHCNGSVKLALMTLLSGLSVEESSSRLNCADGVLKVALDCWENEVQVATPESSPEDSMSVLEKKSDLVACIDGGGSKCAVAISDTSGRIGRAQGGSCNFTDLTIEEVKQVIADTTERALTNYQMSHLEKVVWQSGSTNPPFFSAVLAGLSGFDRPGARQALMPLIKSIFGLPDEKLVEASNDTDLLTAGFRKYPDCRNGIVLISGTGSVAMSFSLDSESNRYLRTGRTGGWGHILGDEGSGFDIGRQAIRSTLKAAESAQKAGSPIPDFPSPFQRAVMANLGVTGEWSPSLDFLSKILKSETGQNYDLKTRIAGVARVVLEHAPTNLFAAHIVSTAATHLVRLLQPHIADKEYIANTVLVLSGGLMKCPPFRSIFLGKLAAENALFRAIEIIEDPATTGVQSLLSRTYL